MSKELVEQQQKALSGTIYKELVAQGVGDDFRPAHFEENDRIGLHLPKRHRCTPTTSKYKDMDDVEIMACNYTVSIPYGFLCDSVMEINFPEIELKAKHADEYRFKLCNYVGYIVAGKAHFKASSDVLINSRTPNDQIVLSKRLWTKSEKRSRASDMGLNSVCRDYTRNGKMPAKTLYYYQTFYYSFFPHKAFPGWRLGNDTSRISDVSHYFEMQLDITKLINLQKWNAETQSWHRCPFNPKLFETPTKGWNLETPDFFLDLDFISEAELARLESHDVKEFYIYDVRNVKTENAVTLTETSNIEVKPSGFVQALFVYGERSDNAKYNITANFTQSHEEFRDTPSPIKALEMKPFIDIHPSGLLEGLGDSIFPGDRREPGILCCPFVRTFMPGNNGGVYLKDNNNALKVKVCDVAPGNASADYKINVQSTILLTLKMQISNAIVTIFNDSTQASEISDGEDSFKRVLALR